MTQPDALIADFRAALRTQPSIDLVRGSVMSGSCRSLSDGAYNSLKKAVAVQFDIHPNEILVVGSAKLGFSIAPDKRYRLFSDTSDIDVALCSSPLFDSIWQAVFDYSVRGETWPELSRFRKYLFRGWMRPDLLPPTPSFQISRDWWEFFRMLTASGQYGDYKIRGALYKSWHFLECYQYTCVQACLKEESSQ